MNFGYYFFNREYIHFDIDTALNSHQLDINVIIENPEKFRSNVLNKLKENFGTINDENETFFINLEKGKILRTSANDNKSRYSFIKI